MKKFKQNTQIEHCQFLTQRKLFNILVQTSQGLTITKKLSMFHTLKNKKMATGILNYSNDLEYSNTFHRLHSNICVLPDNNNVYSKTCNFFQRHFYTLRPKFFLISINFAIE